MAADGNSSLPFAFSPLSIGWSFLSFFAFYHNHEACVRQSDRSSFKKLRACLAPRAIFLVSSLIQFLDLLPLNCSVSPEHKVVLFSSPFYSSSPIVILTIIRRRGHRGCWSHKRYNFNPHIHMSYTLFPPACTTLHSFIY